MKRIPRILIGKVGLDGHTTGIYAVSRALSDAGIEVIFGGIRITPDLMARAAMEEDVDAIGISILSGAHLTVAKNLFKSLEQKGLTNLHVVIGGIVPPEDIPILKSMGVSDVFTPGTSMDEIINSVKSILKT
jgi:methylmalonyl-CoA mutase C-terminal domain/subunit